MEIKQGHARTVVNTAGKKGSTGDGGLGREATLNGPKYVTMDPQGRVLILDTENHCVRRDIPKTGKIELVAGTPGQAGDQLGETWTQTALKRPHGARIGPDGKLYVADSENNRVLAGPYPP